jgi:hypothetical protein
MVVTRAIEPPDLLVATLSGVVTAEDRAALVEWLRDTLQTASEVRVLILLQRFAGWRAEPSFPDAWLWLRDEERITKMAIVGPPIWRIAMLTFLVQPLRRIPISYFETEADARQWLAEKPVLPGGPGVTA